eukprot:6184214-Pleurochrysis_carterae.AAC.2
MYVLCQQRRARRKSRGGEGRREEGRERASEGGEGGRSKGGRRKGGRGRGREKSKDRRMREGKGGRGKGRSKGERYSASERARFESKRGRKRGREGERVAQIRRYELCRGQANLWNRSGSALFKGTLSVGSEFKLNR